MLACMCAAGRHNHDDSIDVPGFRSTAASVYNSIVAAIERKTADDVGASERQRTEPPTEDTAMTEAVSSSGRRRATKKRARDTQTRNPSDMPTANGEASAGGLGIAQKMKDTAPQGSIHTRAHTRSHSMRAMQLTKIENWAPRRVAGLSTEASRVPGTAGDFRAGRTQPLPVENSHGGILVMPY